MKKQSSYRIVQLFFTIFFSSYTCLILTAQSLDLKFEHITSDDGLSHSVVNDVIKDSLGFIWIATNDGLNRFDGMNFKIYRHEPGNPHSLSHNSVYRLHDSYISGRQIIWVGTSGGGLNAFDVETEQFINWNSYKTEVDNSSREPAFCSVLYDSESEILKMWYTNTAGEKKDFTIDYFEVPAEKGIENIDWANTEHKTVLTGGKEGCWDSGAIGHPNVIYDDSLYKMWYVGSTGGLNTSIGYAESKDGIVWIKYPGNPVLTAGGKGSWPAEKGLLYPSVVYDGELYHIFYSGFNREWTTAQMGHAVSVDGLKWTKDDNNPVIRYGRKDSWNAHNICAPAVLFEDGIFKCWYSAFGGGYDGFANIGYTVSEDGSNWQESSEPILFGKIIGSDLNHSSIIHDGEKYIMFYTEGSWYNWSIQYHTSRDGLIWDQSKYRRTYNKKYTYPEGEVIHTIFRDEEGSLWLGLSGKNRDNKGIVQLIFSDIFDISELRKHLYNYEGWEIKRFLTDYSCSDIKQDAYGNIWAACNNWGLFKLENASGNFINFQFEKKYTDPPSYNSNSILPIGSTIWTGMGNGDLISFNIDNPYSADSDLSQKRFKTGLSGNITQIVKYSSNKLLLNSDVGGVCVLDIDNGKMEHLKFDPADPMSIGYGTIGKILIDESNILWVCSEAGLNKFNPNKKKFRNYFYQKRNPKTIRSNYIGPLLETELNGKKNLWIGTRGGGLSKFSDNWSNVKHYQVNTENYTGLEDDWIRCLHEDSEGNIWIGAGTPLQKLNPDTDIFTTYKPFNPGVKKPMVGWGIAAIYEDAQNQIWIGSSEGFEKMNKNEASFYRAGKKGVTNIFAFKDFDTHEIWLGTVDIGLFLYNDKDGTTTSYSVDIQSENKLGSERINTIYGRTVGDKHELWIGSYYGLNRIILEKSASRSEDDLVIERFTENEGLSSNIVVSIIEDDKRNLWLGTNYGLSKFNPDKMEFRNYYKGDGLPSNEFVENSVLKRESGELLFGSKNGLTSFFPDSMHDNREKPNIVITDFRIFNEPVNVVLDTIPEARFFLSKSITYLDTLILSYKENYFSFEFAALDYYNPQKNMYKYILEGFENEWTQTTADRRRVTYTNLEPGEYTFRVTGSNNDGYWNEAGKSLIIIISPPWWAATWAYAAYVLIILLIVYIIWNFQMNRIRLKHTVDLEHLEAEKYREMDRLKSRFFANISHEFRTPLTLILGPVEKMLSKTKGTEFKNDLKLIRRNARRLFNLINQLLDLSKLEANKMIVKASQYNIVSFIKGMVMSFISLAERKDILLKINSQETDIPVYFDRDMMNKIICNIVSNAFKFTERSGSIQVDIRRKPANENDSGNEYVEITIRDTGIGIPPERLDKIFDRFYQVDSSHTREREGTGIGLSLTKELVELHKGEISVSSEAGKGTKFTLLFPLGKTHLKPEEIRDLPGTDTDFEQFVDDSQLLEESLEEINTIDSELSTVDDKPIILVVEDNRDVRNYIKDYLLDKYNLIEADNGMTGLELALENIPDLILSDIMMPKMNGVELCNKLKNDERTCHIPVILLTAKASGEDKLEGLETGADDYIMKPFDARELQVRIKNLINQRKKLREYFKKQGIFEIDEESIMPADKKFLQKANNIINNHISEPDFNVNAFADEMALSRSQLHRKFTALYNESPSDFIRRIRLSRAAKLIEQNFGNISEIALEVGFNNPAHFTKCFKQQFHKTPSEFEKSV